MDVAAAIAVLTQLGVLPAITIVAVIGISAVLWRRFKH